jgi:hypothetical protein
VRRWWKLVLPCVNLALAIWLFSVGTQQWKRYSNENPGAFHEGSYWYMPAAWQIGRSINAPAYLVSEWVHVWHREHGWWQDMSFQYGYREFYVAVVLLWFWVGLVIQKPEHRPNLHHWLGMCEGAVILVLGLCLIVRAALTAGDFTYYVYLLALRLSTAIWGGLLIWYVARSVRITRI